MGKGLVLAVTPSIKLRENQAKLYAFIVNKHKLGSTITLTEVVKQYSEYGNRNIYNGEPHVYVYDWKNHNDNLTLLKGAELNMYAIQWFVRNLGIFVVKGLLTAIPTIELSQVQIEQEPKPTNSNKKEQV